jgi:hypothetical protein
MAAVSNNKYDVYEWIIKVYSSCETFQQASAANKLRQNFEKVYNDKQLNWELDWYNYSTTLRISDSSKSIK